ncbi:MAG: hypothetical protein Q7V20_19915 [Aquabacterium sp.]|jgi:hypothetical protein|uniref:hypothetical protein n=1 Tax=unclassified Aquabacterium TaxID=2620789 RepID=UPI0008BCDAA7|nr:MULTISPECIES: hypothetical protein [unclassified Aquabacterium]OGA83131.1 MAG: hypothetical protein A2711_13660 [Burkholderiales bacterium RIFCSPHIGHO2_01_FULL_63_240]OGB04400.1 MAG: hypothetical protein A3E52_15370 [Burkholderiales bacterium RIFCSPHIGHO2_12_FULL_63_20]OGB61075.1 MAG: hypothetical protein A3G29_06195 [Burkholderiales bacterium RIFCSPLOWO2_12_FULL_64_99]RZI81793.1 MAG: hypothetical protein EOP38_18075 [Rubrivivax sp.]MDI1347610.1 hypothetical protein [Aquabacterium sp.]
MTMPRALKHWICRLMVGVILFAQMSVAAYACPSNMVSGNATADAITAMGAMVDCEQMGEGMGRHLDQANPGLCAEHCHPTQQSDHTQAPTVPAALLIALYTVALTVDASRPDGLAPTADSRLHAAPPPLSILHCCFRI